MARDEHLIPTLENHQIWPRLGIKGGARFLEIIRVFNGLEVQVHIEMHVDISLGLEVPASVFSYFSTAMEVIMKNLSAIIGYIMASVWCGVAFLRSPAKKALTQARDGYVRRCVTCQE